MTGTSCFRCEGHSTRRHASANSTVAGQSPNILSGIDDHRRLTPTSPQPAPRGAPGVVEGPAKCGGFAPPPCDAVQRSTCHPGQAAACLPTASASPTHPTLFGLPKLIIIIRTIMRSHFWGSGAPNATAACTGACRGAVGGATARRGAILLCPFLRGFRQGRLECLLSQYYERVEDIEVNDRIAL